MEQDGRVAAYGGLFAHGESAELDGFVHPTKTGLGLGAWLLRERRGARARSAGFPVARTWCLAPDDAARRLFERAAFARCAGTTGC